MRPNRHEAVNSPRVNARVADRRLPVVAMPPWMTAVAAAPHGGKIATNAEVCGSAAPQAGDGPAPARLAIPVLSGRDIPVRSRSCRSILWLTLGAFVSIAVHGAIFAYALLKFDSSVGAGGETVEAISVELVTATALEAIDVAPSIQSGGASQPVTTRAGAEAPVDQVEVQPQTDSRKAAPSAAEEAIVKPAPQDSSEPEFRAAENMSQRENSVVADPVLFPEHDDAPQKEVEKEKGRAQAEQRAQEALMAGQAMSRAVEASEATSAAAPATHGAVMRYAMMVRAALGASRPPYTGKRGRVVVSFVIDEAGSASNVKITSSSGNEHLDNVSAATVQRIVFPKPSSELTASQRQFVVPFDFK